MDETQKHILECMFGVWMDNGMPLYSNLSYQDVVEFMEWAGVDKGHAVLTYLKLAAPTK